MIEINIVGTTGVGKTTIGVIIERALKEAGIDVKPMMDGEALMTTEAKDNLIRYGEVKQPVTISEVFARRSGHW